MSGYASNSSTKSNKKTCFAADLDDALAAYGGATRNPSTSPAKLGYSTINAFVATLHKQMCTPIIKGVHKFVRRFATWFCKKATLDMMKRNADFIPADARISLLLHPIEEVARDPGFQDLIHEMASIVEQ